MQLKHLVKRLTNILPDGLFLRLEYFRNFGRFPDLKNPKTNRKNAGFTDEERNKMTNLLEAGFTDSFRKLYPDKENCYTWWSYMGNAREKNVGWRIDYFITSDRIGDRIKDSLIYPEIMGSDHCPVGLKINLK